MHDCTRVQLWHAWLHSCAYTLYPCRRNGTTRNKLFVCLQLKLTSQKSGRWSEAKKNARVWYWCVMLRVLRAWSAGDAIHWHCYKRRAWLLTQTVLCSLSDSRPDHVAAVGRVDHWSVCNELQRSDRLIPLLWFSIAFIWWSKTDSLRCEHDDHW